jgi:hypothetical protein
MDLPIFAKTTPVKRAASTAWLWDADEFGEDYPHVVIKIWWDDTDASYDEADVWVVLHNDGAGRWDCDFDRYSDGISPFNRGVKGIKEMLGRLTDRPFDEVRVTYTGELRQTFIALGQRVMDFRRETGMSCRIDVARMQGAPDQWCVNECEAGECKFARQAYELGRRLEWIETLEAGAKYEVALSQVESFTGTLAQFQALIEAQTHDL